ncbi:unnamed protein product, partial [Prorocentrum cordatum]
VRGAVGRMKGSASGKGGIAIGTVRSAGPRATMAAAKLVATVRDAPGDAWEQE